MLSEIIAITGIFFGLIIAYYTKEELEYGKKYFILIQFAVLITLFFISLNYNTFYFIIGAVIGILIRNPFIYFGILALNSVNQVISSIIIFIYCLADGSIIFMKRNFKIIIMDLFLFILPFILIIFKIDLLPILSGGIFGIILYNIYIKFLKSSN